MVHDMAAVFVVVVAAAFAWVQVLAGVAAMVLCAVPLCVAPGVRAARSRLGARVTAEQPTQAPEPQPAYKRRSVPSWAHTEPDKEAA